MRLSDLFSDENIELDFPPAEKEKLLEEIIKDLDSKALIKDYDLTLQHVIEREKVMSTGIGNGVAIPHAYSDGVNQLVAGFFRTSHGVDFSAVDGKAVDLIFIILGPKENRRDHIKILAKISRLLHHEEFREGLRKAPTPKAVFDVFKRFGDR
ncbi:MAG: PTS transporter subunit EIIA [Candidatus Latescibacteria bacterium]|nr:PTS transporter subunit EIIA [Candidatus Latescibacterota bacterium]NIM21599.1 PTS transporter subunit EIIA [Candidatus Latescibacterota bacterium]NIM64578.1 PTS transporter subunit EIIA [Candidatus Latescibacterota bacterium]NIO01093.1 PTS transporter subunit EIIA [Candidatus Latescibacterota bacterium]NIO27486.1 PTS transporter subunit EIIA [Candidatus Latescibacterota bacterium]